MWQAIAKDVGLCAAFALLLFAPLGRSILKRLGKGGLPDSLALAVPLGMAAWGFCILALGWWGVLSRAATLLVIAVLFLLLRLHRHLLPSSPWRFLPPMGFGDRIAASILGTLSLYFLAVALGSSLAPETAFDSLNVHLPYARQAAETQRAGFASNNWSSVMPALPLMTYITAFQFSGITLAKLFNALCYLACGGVIFSFARRWWDLERALAAALLFWSCPVSIYEAGTALIDLPCALFSALTVLSLLQWAISNSKPFLWLSAVSLGLALGCKYHAAFWYLPILLVISWHVLRIQRLPLRTLIPLLVRYTLIAGLIFLPWPARAWYYTGNPVFPLANKVFESAYFPPAMAQAAQAAYANEGIGASWRALLELPWAIFFHPGSFRGTLGYIFLLGVLLALLRRKAAPLRYAPVLCLTYFYSWAFTAQEIRYLLPLVPLLSVITAAGVLGTEPGNGPQAAPSGRILKSAGLLAVALGAAMTIPPIYRWSVREWTYWHSFQSPLPYLAGRQTAEEFLQRDVPSIYVHDYINEHLGRTDRILLLNDASRFYSKVPTLYSFTVEGEEILHQADEEQLLARLRKSGISHVLLNYNGIAPLPGVAPRYGVYLFLDDGFRERRLEPLYSKNKVVLYRLRS